MQRSIRSWRCRRKIAGSLLLYCVAEFASGDAATVHDAVQAAARDTLARAVERARAAVVEPEMRVGEGDPAAALVDAAQGYGEDLIVVGSHGRRGLRRAFLGSVAEHVVRTARTPVLVIRAAPAPAKAPPAQLASSA